MYMYVFTTGSGTCATFKQKVICCSQPHANSQGKLEEAARQIEASIVGVEQDVKNCQDDRDSLQAYADDMKEKETVHSLPFGQ